MTRAGGSIEHGVLSEALDSRRAQCARDRGATRAPNQLVQTHDVNAHKKYYDEMYITSNMAVSNIGPFLTDQNRLLLLLDNRRCR